MSRSEYIQFTGTMRALSHGDIIHRVHVDNAMTGVYINSLGHLVNIDGLIVEISRPDGNKDNWVIVTTCANEFAFDSSKTLVEYTRQF
jgi:hypothetical protein